MNSLRIEGQKTISIRTRPAVRLGVPDLIIIPGGNLGKRERAGQGFHADARFGDLSTKAAPHRLRPDGKGQSPL